MVTCILSLLGSKGVFICNVAWKRIFRQNRQATCSPFWNETELLIEAHLVFSAPALNLVVALFQPRWGHFLPVRSGNVAVTNLPEQQGHLLFFLGRVPNIRSNSRVKIMGVVSTTKVSDVFPIPQDTFQPKQAHLV